jgi:hypothetical protein
MEKVRLAELVDEIDREDKGPQTGRSALRERMAGVDNKKVSST